MFLMMKKLLNQINQIGTKGISLNPLVIDVINIMQTNDVEIKRLIYSFFHLQKSIDEKVIMLAVNSFVKDLFHSNEYVRSWAIECCAFIGTETFIEVNNQNMLTLLKDRSSIVKLSCLNVLKREQFLKVIEIEEVNEIVNGMTMEKNSEIVVNALVVLTEWKRIVGKSTYELSEKQLIHLIQITEKCSSLEIDGNLKKKEL